ncbi:hypothetical protein [Bombella saccharophila]|uniref:Uncharacterized protein n=1 Tax=Bombella saccharophila TaxID=2967338 RepID=A0ABT3W5R0_9PROT|nr:hypothetical protein [Bombella saccharophila]MCX5614406.1 hypothetical protein [Bombella saccharophila]
MEEHRHNINIAMMIALGISHDDVLEETERTFLEWYCLDIITS